MQSITLTAIVDENGQLVVDVPPEISPGPVEVVIRPTLENGEAPPEPQTRERIRAKLIDAGRVNPNAEELSEEEELRLGMLLKGDHPVEDYISEDREERF